MRGLAARDVPGRIGTGAVSVSRADPGDEVHQRCWPRARSSLHKPGSIWPTPTGIAVSKDVWMLGIGLGLLAAVLTRRQ